MLNPMTTQGDIIYEGSSSASRLGIGSSGQVLTVASGVPSWATPSGGGMTNPMSASGDIIVGGTSGAPARLAKGSDTQVLTLASGTPSWAAPTSGGMTNPMTAAGDIIIGGSSGAADRLAKGSDTQVLTLVSGAPAWAAASGGGGGSTVGVGVASSRPSAGTAGNIYYPTDGIEPSIDNGTAWVPLARPGMPWPPLLSTFTQINGSNLTLADIPGGGISILPTGTSGKGGAIGVAPTSNYDHRCCASIGFLPAGSIFGMCVADSVGNNFECFQCYWPAAGPPVLQLNRNNPWETWGGTTFSSGNTFQVLVGSSLFLRIQESSGTRYFSYSIDGLTWITAGSETVSGAFVTTPTLIAFFVDNGNTSGGVVNLLGWI
jgi:hypothetical protein